MAVLFQMGHQSQVLVTHEFLSLYAGAILSPANSDVRGMSKFVEPLRSRHRTSFETIFDPQLYFPRTGREKLRKWSYFPNDFETADLSAEDWWENTAERLVETVREIAPHAACSPATVPLYGALDYYGLVVRGAEHLAKRLAPLGVETLLTLIVRLADLTDPRRVQGIASVASRFTGGRVYLVLIGEMEPRRELRETAELTGTMRLIRALEEAGVRVVVGFASSDVVLWKAAGATSCATGRFFNLRRFTRSRFDVPDDGGTAKPTWFEESLLAFVREADVVRLRDACMLSEPSLQNPYGEQILERLDVRDRAADASDERWLSLSAQQYLYWFAEIETRIRTGEVKVLDLLRQAQANWLELEDRNIYLQDPRNNGSWIRPWQIAVSDFVSGR